MGWMAANRVNFCILQSFLDFGLGPAAPSVGYMDPPLSSNTQIERANENVRCTHTASG